MTVRMLVTTAAVSVAAAAAASAPSTATAALENCKRLTAGGKTWQVSATAKPGCATARNIVRQVTARKPDRVSHAQGGLLGHSSTVVTERAYAELLGTTIRDELLAVLDPPHHPVAQ